MSRLQNLAAFAILFIVVLAILLPNGGEGVPSLAQPSTGGGTVSRQEVKVVINSVGMKMVSVPAGEFVMGSPPTQEGRRENEKQHKVKIERGFFLGQFEVTVQQFRRFVDETQFKTDAEKDPLGSLGFDTEKGDHFRHPRFNWRNLGFKQEDNHAVANVSWNDAVAYCRWLSKTTGQSYRLPTESEWEYACRAGSEAPFHTGVTCQGGGNIADLALRKVLPGFAWCRNWDDGFAFTAPVGSFKANAFGLHDMHGNVMEWCSDRHDLYGSQVRSAKTRATAKQDSAGEAKKPFRVSRGGAWGSRSTRSTASYREVQLTASWRGYYSGFRVLCSDEAIQVKPAGQ